MTDLPAPLDPEEPPLPAIRPEVLAVFGNPERERFRSMLTRINPTTFSDLNTAEMYQAAFVSYVRQFEGVPGFGALEETLCEVMAYLWSSHKDFAMRGDPLPANAYLKLFTRFESLARTLYSARNERDAEEAYKYQFVTQFLRDLDEVLGEILGNTDSEALQVQIVSRLSARMTRRDQEAQGHR